TDIRGFTLQALRDQISFVLQDTLLFHAPIWQNIAYGRPDASRAEIVHAAELANAHEFIEEMAEGYDTMVGERGVTLSGGQRQRIAIARAVIRNTPILVLDEPTSGLDAQAERAVFEALDRLMTGKTCIVIAHHLTTILGADIIFVVRDHRLAERGTHEQLLAAGGFYAKLYNIQFGEEAAAGGGLGAGARRLQRETGGHAQQADEEQRRRHAGGLRQSGDLPRRRLDDRRDRHVVTGR